MGVVANVAINVDAANAIQQLNRVRDAAGKLNNELGKTPQTSQQAKNGFHSIAGAVAGLTAKLAAGYTAAKVLSDSLGTFFARNQAEQQLKNLTSSTEEYNAALALAERQVQMFGISQTEATKAIGDTYSKLSGVGYGLKEIGEIYQGFNIIVTQTGVASQDAAGAFFQLSQALAKGKLNGDEFVTISERMPQLLNAISENTGIARGQFKEMAEQGKLTGQLIYQALAQASQGAGDLNRFLTGQAVAMSNLKVAADRVFYVIGALFGPVVTAATQGFADLLGEVEKAVIANYGMFKQFLGVLTAIASAVLPAMAGAFQFVFKNIKAILQTVTFFGTFIGILKGIVLATQAWTAATKALATAQKVAALAATALQVIMNPGAIAKILTGIAGAALATAALGRAMDAAAASSTKVKDESSGVLKEVDAILKKYSAVPPVIESSRDKQQALKEQTKAYKEEVERAKVAFEQLTTAQDQALNAIENSLKIAQARVQAEQAVNNAIKQQLQTQLEQAKTQQERVAIAQRIYQVEVANAESVLALTKLQIQTEIDRAQIAAGTQALLYESLQVELAIARARQQNTTELERALVKQQSALQIAFQNVKAVEQIAKYQRLQADATFDAQVSAAKLAFQQNITAKETAKAATSSSKFADNMERAGIAAEKTADAVNKIVKIGAKSSFQGAAATGYGGAMGIEDPELRKKALKIWEDATKFAANKDIRVMGDIFQRARDAIAKLSLQGYAAQNKAKGNLIAPTPVNSTASLPANTNTAGLAELPQSSGLSMQPGGGPGTAIIDRMPSTINLQTGPVLQQENGEKYVRLGDLETILQDFAATVFNNARSTGGRRFQGVN